MVLDFKVSGCLMLFEFLAEVGRKLALELKCTA